MSETNQKTPPGILKLAAISAVCFASIGIITPVLDPLVRGKFGLGNSETAQFMGINGASSMLFGIIAGILSDRWGRRVPLIIFGLIGSGLATIAIPFIPNFNALLVLRFFDGIANAFCVGLLITRAFDLAGREGRSRAMAFMSISISVGFIIAPILTGTIGTRSLEWLFSIVGVALILGGLAMISDLRSVEHVERLGGGGREIFRAFYSTPRLAIPVLFSFVEKFTFGTLAHLTSLMVKDAHGLGTRESSAVILGFWILFSVSCLPGGKLASRIGSLPVLIIGAALYGSCFALMGVVPFWGFAALMAISGAFCALQYVPSVALVGEIAEPTKLGISMGVWNVAGSLGIVMGMVVSGKLSAHSYALAYGVAGGMELVCAAIGLALWLSRARVARASRP